MNKTKLSIDQVKEANLEIGAGKREMTASLKAEMKEAISSHSESGDSRPGYEHPEKEIAKLKMFAADNSVEKTFALQKALIDTYCRSTYGVSFRETLGFLGVNPAVHTYEQAKEILKFSASAKLSKILTESGLTAPFRWAIREMILNPVTDGYQAAVAYPRWISGISPVTSRNSIVPKELYDNDTQPTVLMEGETISIGTIKMGEKDVKVRKYGLALVFSSEVLRSASIDIAGRGIRNTGTKMGRMADALGLDTLINGEQANGSEAISMVGITTSGTLQRKDLIMTDQVFSDMGKILNTMISTRLTNTEVTELLAYTANGANEDTRLREMFAGVLNNKTSRKQGGNNLIILGDNRSMMRKLQFGGLEVEEDRIPEKDSDAIFVRESLGFYIEEPTSRIGLRKDLALASYPYPEAMDAQEMFDITNF